MADIIVIILIASIIFFAQSILEFKVSNPKIFLFLVCLTKWARSSTSLLTNFPKVSTVGRPSKGAFFQYAKSKCDSGILGIEKG